MTPTPVARTVLLLVQASSGNEASLLDNVKIVVDILGTAVTAAAVIIGGMWAYFKFVKGRTYRPRLEPSLSGRWQLIDGQHLLRARITVQNIGASNVTLLQEGTGLRVSVLALDQPPPPTLTAWDQLGTFPVLAEHEWIEPGETVADDLLLNLGVSGPRPTLFETRLVWRLSKRDHNIVVFARQVIPMDSTIDEAEEPSYPAGQKGRGG
jgi:hypothetical protein